MPYQKEKFLFDENIDYNLRKLFDEFRLKFSTVQKEGWGGSKNGEICKLVKDNDFIILTNDSDFEFLWKKYLIKVIYFAIKPANIEDSTLELRKIFNNWTIKPNQSFLIKIQKRFIRTWYENPNQ